jgi:hypothetical protein
MVRHREKKKGENGRKTGNNRRRQSGTAERRLDGAISYFYSLFLHPHFFPDWQEPPKPNAMTTHKLCICGKGGRGRGRTGLCFT